MMMGFSITTRSVMMKQIGIIGAGAMGKGIAANCQKAGYNVTAFKRTIDENDEKITYLREHGVAITTDLQEIFSSSDILLTCLSDSPTMESLMLGEDGLLASSSETIKVVIDFTTALPDSTQKIAGLLEKKGIAMLDAPMTRGPKQAEEGTINLVVGGPQQVFETYRPLLESVSACIVFAGPAGSGNTVKLMNNFMSLMTRAAGSLTALLIQRKGVSLEAFKDFISVSGGNSAGFQAVMRSIMEDDFSPSFALRLAHKDLKYNKMVFEDSENELLDVTLKYYREAEEAGYGDADTNAIYQSLKAQLDR